MNHLYAPWRDTYTKEDQEQTSSKQCIFCTQIADNNDTKYFIMRRYEKGLIMLNLYPYNPGHLLIIPYHHTTDLAHLQEAERAEMMELVTRSSTILQHTLKAHGINIGLNMGGKAAGGSIPEHIHIHVIPRWFGDTNFLAIVSETKVITLDLHSIYRQLHVAFNV
jgi:ATP adenylyltransferase